MSFEFKLIEKTLGQVFDETVAKYPDNEALMYVDSKIRFTWGELGKFVDSLARGFMALGVERGDKLALWSVNVHPWEEAMLAVAKTGSVLVPVNTGYREKELEYLLAHSDATTLLVGDTFRDFDFLECFCKVVPEIKELTGDKRGTLKSAKFPFLKRVIFMGENAPAYTYSVAEVMEMGKQVSEADFKARQEAVKPEDLVNIQYTSGTTGNPKGVMLSHLNVVNDGYWNGRMQNLGPSDRICLTVPFFHNFGSVAGIICSVCHASALVVISSGNPAQIMSVIQEGCTAFYGVPAMYHAILHHRLFEKIDFSCLRTGIMGGSICPTPLMEAVIKKMHMPEITIAYGLTESSPTMTMTSYLDNMHHRTTSGGHALPGTEVRIIDPHTGKEMPQGEWGEICCRGFNVMMGYYKNPEATAEVIDKNGFLHSGDLGYLDKDGYVTVSGRIKDLIIRAGENVYPREIEEFISQMPGVKDVQVVSVPSRRYGEEVGAFIVPQPGVKLTQEDVRNYSKGKIAWYKVPRYVSFVESFPLNPSGKVQKFKLREMAAELFPNAMK